MSDLGELYLESAIKRFENLKELGDGALRQLDDADVRHAPDVETNSIAIIVQHLHGNMLSRWTDFLTTDGDKPWRERDAEFEDQAWSHAEVVAKWEAGWKCTLDTLRGLQPGDLVKEVEIRGMPLSALDAINRQIAHYGYHVGQLVQLAKMRKGSAWQTLSIARGQSGKYVPRARD